MVKFLNPIAGTAIENESYELAHDIRANGGAGVTVGLLANGFPDSETVPDEGRERAREPASQTRNQALEQGQRGVPASSEMLAEVTSSCQIAIAAYGH